MIELKTLNKNLVDADIASVILSKAVVFQLAKVDEVMMMTVTMVMTMIMNLTKVSDFIHNAMKTILEILREPTFWHYEKKMCHRLSDSQCARVVEVHRVLPFPD